MAFDRPDHLHDTFATAMAAGDVDGLLELYETDAVSVAPDGTVVAGTDALRAMFTGLLGGENSMVGRQRTTVVVGDLALTSTTWTAELPADNATTTQRGTTAEVSRRRPDGTWRVVIDSPFFA